VEFSGGVSTANGSSAEFVSNFWSSVWLPSWSVADGSTLLPSLELGDGGSTSLSGSLLGGLCKQPVVLGDLSRSEVGAVLLLVHLDPFSSADAGEASNEDASICLYLAAVVASTGGLREDSLADPGDTGSTLRVDVPNVDPG
jgi:hypothetical protein